MCDGRRPEGCGQVLQRAGPGAEVHAVEVAVLPDLVVVAHRVAGLLEEMHVDVDHAGITHRRILTPSDPGEKRTAVSSQSGHIALTGSKRSGLRLGGRNGDVTTELVLRGGLVDGTERDVVVSRGTIVDLTEPGAGGPARRVIDATGLTVLPGAVDAHVHFDEPGRDEWEGWASGSLAAAAGGVTTVVDM